MLSITPLLYASPLVLFFPLGFHLYSFCVLLLEPDWLHSMENRGWYQHSPDWSHPGPIMEGVCFPRLCAMLSCFSHIQLFGTPWNVAHSAPLSMGFCRQAYWSGLLFPSPGDIPDPGMKPKSSASPALPVNSLPLNHLGSSRLCPMQTVDGTHICGEWLC